MNKQIILRTFISNELDRYKELESKYKNDIAQLPKGSISKTRKNTFYRVYRESGKQIKTKLKAEDAELFNDLQKKRQAKAALPYITSKIKLYESFLDNDFIYDPCVIAESLPSQYFDPTSSYMFLKDDINPYTWEDSLRKASEFRKENLIHVTEYGVSTRSKSEAMIGTQLEHHGLHYCHEPELDLGFRKVRPDFAVFIPSARKIIYWEHFGLVDNPVYMMNALRKIDDYIKAGYYPGINLIITYETKDHPLTIFTINQKIKELLAM